MNDEISFCIEIINLFENGSLSNEEVKIQVEKRDLLKRAGILNKIKQESEFSENSDIDYEKRIKYAIEVLDEEKSERHRYGFLDYVWRLEELFGNYDLNASQMWECIQLVQYDIAVMHLLKYTIVYLIKREDIESAYFYIEKMPVLEYSNEETKSKGYLLLLEYFAEKGDLVNFAKILKNSNARKNRGDVAFCKSLFVSVFSKENSLEDIFKLISNKVFGLKFLAGAVHSYAENKPYSDIKTLLDTDSRFKELLYEDRVCALLNSYINDKILINNEIVFNEIFNLLAPINRKIRNGDAKLIDSLFFDLAVSVKYNKEWIIKCRKAIKHNSMKRDLDCYINQDSTNKK